MRKPEVFRESSPHSKLSKRINQSHVQRETGISALNEQRRKLSSSSKFGSRSRSSKHRQTLDRSRSRTKPNSRSRSSKHRSILDRSRSKTPPLERVGRHLSLLNDEITKPARMLYVGNLPRDIGLDEIKFREFLTQACDVVGIKTEDPIISVWMSRDKTYCFAEFRSVQDTEKAKKLLSENEIKIGERFLKFGRPKDFKPCPPHLESYVVGGVDPPLPKDMDVSAYIQEVYEQLPNVFKKVIGGDSNVENTANGVKYGDGMTPILLLKNMVSNKDIDDDTIYKQVFADIKMECTKYGHIRQLLIPRRGYIKGDRGILKVFVNYEHVESAVRAKWALEHKVWDNRKIDVSFYDESRFANRNL